MKTLGGLVDFYLVINESTHTRIDTQLGFNHLVAHARTYRLIKSLCNVPVSSAHMATQTFPYRYYDELDRVMAAYLDFQYNGCFLHAIATGELISPFGEAEECPELRARRTIGRSIFIPGNLSTPAGKSCPLPVSRIRNCG